MKPSCKVLNWHFINQIYFNKSRILFDINCALKEIFLLISLFVKFYEINLEEIS